MSVLRRAVASVASLFVILSFVANGQPARAAQLDGVPDVVALGAITPSSLQPNDIVRASLTVNGDYAAVMVLLVDEYGGTHALQGRPGTDAVAFVADWWPSGHYRIGAIQVTTGTLLGVSAGCFYCYVYYDLASAKIYEGAYDDGFTNFRSAVSSGVPFTPAEIDASSADVTNPDGDATIADLESATITGAPNRAFPAGAAPRFTASWGVDDRHPYVSGSVSVVSVHHGVNDWNDVHTWYFDADPSTRNATVDLSGLPNGRYRVSSLTLLTDDRYQLQATLDGSSTYPPTIGGGAVHVDLSTVRFSVGVPPDVTPPVLVVPASVTAEAERAAGATVAYVASADDAVDGPVLPSCAPSSGTTFAIGTTTVTCIATDDSGNVASRSFDVLVRDTTAPVVVVPTAATAEATSPSGAPVVFAASASDLVDGAVTPTCTPASGATFPLGATSVTCSAADAHGNATSASFVVSIVDTTAPVFDPVPALAAVEATGPAGAPVAYTVSANDLVDGVVATSCTPASGSTFPLGTSHVTCRATDAHGNAATSTFDVSVHDTTAPVLTLRGNAGTYDVDATVSISCTAYDVVSSPACAPPSFSAAAASFTVGPHTVSFSATDAAGNRGIASATFAIKPTVKGMINLTDARVTKQLAGPLDAKLRSGSFQAYRQQLSAQIGKGISQADADILTAFSYALS